jgi:hopene-associated glycosyltransferase HpnB
VRVCGIAAAASLVAWLYLTLLHGRFWTTSVRLPEVTDEPADGRWPTVVAVVPARNEAAMLPETLPSLLGQDYPGVFRVVLVDDASEDGTGEVARRLAAGHPAGDRLQVVRGDGPPPGWAGKVAAMATGVRHAGEPEFLLFTDADIAHPADSARTLVRAALGHRLDLVSLMARLRTRTGWERAVVPAFVYFFAQLYPFRRVRAARSRVAAAAGGCMLLRASTLAAAGGLDGIRGALIDDVALGTLIKRSGGRCWLGLTTEVRSVRPYPSRAHLWDMVARSAYTQLRHSPALLAGTLAGLLLLYALPPVAAVAGVVGLLAHVDASWLAAVAGLAGWLLLAGSFLPMLRFYRLGGWRAPLLPGVAMLYAAMTLDSARRHRRGRGGAWKGRVRSAGAAPVEPVAPVAPTDARK